MLTKGCCYTKCELSLTILRVVSKSIGQASFIYLVHFRARQPQEKGKRVVKKTIMVLFHQHLGRKKSDFFPRLTGENFTCIYECLSVAVSQCSTITMQRVGQDSSNSDRGV